MLASALITCLPACAFICLPVLPARRAAGSPLCACTCLPAWASICRPALPDLRHLPVLPDCRAACSPVSSLTCLPACAFNCLGPHSRHLAAALPGRMLASELTYLTPSTRLHLSRAAFAISPCCRIAGPHARQWAPSFVSSSAARSPGRVLASARINLPPACSPVCAITCLPCFSLAHKRDKMFIVAA